MPGLLKRGTLDGVFAVAVLMSLVGASPVLAAARGGI